MPTLSPQQQFQITPERGVVDPDTTGAMAGLVGNTLQNISNIASNQKKPTQSDTENLLYQGLVNGLQEAQALRDQGREAEALQLERRIEVNFNRLGGDSGDTRFKELVLSYTGKEADAFGFSPDEVAAQRIMESSEFQNALISTYATHPPSSNPDMTQQQRTELAMSSLSRQQANGVLAANAEFDWNVSSEAAFGSLIQDFQNTVMGGLRIAAEQDGDVTLEEVQQMRAGLQNFRTQVYSMRPAGISTEQWKPIEDRLNALDDQFAYIEGLEGVDNLNAQATSNLISSLNQLDISDPEKNIWTRVLTGDPQLFLDFGVMSGEEGYTLLDALKTNEKGPAPTRMLLSEDAWDLGPDGELGDPVATFNRARTVLKAANGAGKNLTADEGTRNTWAEAAIRGMSYARQMAVDGDWVTSDEYDSMFGDAFVENLGKVKNADPALYKALTSRAQQVLTTSAVTMNERLISLTEGQPWEFNPNTGEFRISPEGMKELVPGPLQDRVLGALEEHYGSDIMAAISDRGNAIPDEQVRKAFQSIAYRFSNVPEQVRELSNSVAAIERLQAGLVQQGSDTRVGTNQALPASFAPIKAGIFAGESGGDYDALFGYSQRPGGRFEGVKLTEMTVDEAIEFSNPRGAYGTWVRNELGRLGQEQRVATPMGAYQIVGTTLKEAKKALGLTGDEMMTAELQDRLGYYIYQTQGTGAWVGYKGPRDPSSVSTSATGRSGIIAGIPVSGTSAASSAGQAVAGPGTSVPIGGSAPQAQMAAPASSVTAATGPTVSGQPQTNAGQAVARRLSEQAKAQLAELNLDPNSLPSFEDADAVEEAIDSGQLEPGSVIIFQGQPTRIPDDG